MGFKAVNHSLNNQEVEDCDRVSSQNYREMWPGAVCVDALINIQNKVDRIGEFQRSLTKVFLLRRKSMSRKCVNISDIVEIAIKYGYKPIYIEDLSLKEQIDIFASTKHLISELGSTSCNSILMPRYVLESSLQGLKCLGGGACLCQQLFLTGRTNV